MTYSGGGDGGPGAAALRLLEGQPHVPEDENILQYHLELGPRGVFRGVAPDKNGVKRGKKGI